MSISIFFFTNSTKGFFFRLNAYIIKLVFAFIYPLSLFKWHITIFFTLNTWNVFICIDIRERQLSSNTRNYNMIDIFAAYGLFALQITNSAFGAKLI